MSTLSVGVIEGNGSEWSLLTSGTVSSDISVDVSAYTQTGKWDAIKFVCTNMTFSTDSVNCNLTFSNAGLAMATNYKWFKTTIFSNTTTNADATDSQSNSDTDVEIATGIANDGAINNAVEIVFFETDVQTSFRGGVSRFTQEDNAAAPPVGYFLTSFRNDSVATGHLTNIALAPSSGTIDGGNYRVYGRYKY